MGVGLTSESLARRLPNACVYNTPIVAERQMSPFGVLVVMANAPFGRLRTPWAMSRQEARGRLTPSCGHAAEYLDLEKSKFKSVGIDYIVTDTLFTGV